MALRSNLILLTLHNQVNSAKSLFELVPILYKSNKFITHFINL